MFPLILVGLLGFFSWGVHAVLLAPLGIWPGVREAFTVLYAFSVLNLLWLFFVRWKSDRARSTGSEKLREGFAFETMGAYSFLIFLVAVSAIVAGVARFAFGVETPILGRPETSAAILVGAAVLWIMAYIQARRGPRVRQVRVEFPFLPAGFRLRIVQISDLHVGNWIGRDYVEDVVAKVRALAPDLVLATGDMADGDPDLLAQAIEPLRQARGSLGAYYCTGNHEFYWDEPGWKKRLAALDFTVLENSHRSIEVRGVTVNLIGVNELKPDPGQAFAGVGEGLNLVLYHHPKFIRDPGGRPTHLQFSGHTHAGQFVPWTLIIGLIHRFANGLYAVPEKIAGRAQDAWIYVNPGTGFWGPALRLGSRSEITEMVIEASSENRS